MTALGEFLKVRRAAVTPEQVGLPSVGNPRRVSGLRREEVAWLAGVSVDHYTRLEQGRVSTASAGVLAAIARALQLTEDEHAYLRTLADPAQLRHREVVSTVDAPTVELLDELKQVPALVLGRHTDILAWNPAAVALFCDFAGLTPEHRNLVRLVFLDPGIRALYVDWEEVAAEAVARLRMDAVDNPADQRLTGLIDDLSLDPDFRRWWEDHTVRAVTSGRKRILHPVVGLLELSWQAMLSAAVPGQVLVTYTAPAGSPSRDRLRALTSDVSSRVDRAGG